MSAPSHNPTHGIELSVLAPAHNEEENIGPLLEQIEAALRPTGIAFEAVIVDDGSTDSTPQRLREAMSKYPWLRVVKMLHTPPGRGMGISAAFYAGIRATRGRLIAFLDADLQNDPADIPAMVELQRREDADVVQGDRSAKRRDNAIRRATSATGRAFRRWVLGDRVRDTGCSLRVVKRSAAMTLPLQYKGMHRFVPFYLAMQGFRVVETPVHHRPRIAGVAKFGVWNRALPGFIDLLAVRWMSSRWRAAESNEVMASREEVLTPDS